MVRPRVLLKKKMSMDKKNLSDLALFGNLPLFKEQKHVGKPYLENAEKFLNFAKDILDSRYFTNDGPYLKKLESSIKEIIGAKHCLAICNATIGLMLAIKALDLSGEVIVPSMTFIAAAHALAWQGIQPVFADIHPRTFTLDPNEVERLITKKTTGILGVHLWGCPCEIEKLQKIADDNKLKLLFDAAHAFDCKYQGKKIGNFGEVEVFSFHATKFVNAFEGGVITTNNDLLAEKIRLMRNFGFSGYDNVVSLGINGKMSEISAAMGLCSLDELKKNEIINKRNYGFYKEFLSNIPGISLLECDETTEPNYQYLIIFINQEKSSVSRDELQKILFFENVLARRYFYPGCAQMPYYLRKENCFYLPHTEKISQQVLALPTGGNVTEEDIKKIASVIKISVNHANEVKKMLMKKTHEKD